MNTLLARLKRRILGLLSYYPCRFSKDEWDRQYSAGRWDSLRQVGELAHNSIIAGYFRYYGNKQFILDVGCGEGALQGILGADAYARYVGVDISKEAISRARSKQTPNTVFVCEDVANFAPGERFQVIVFNECLYYFDDPAGTMARYENFLCDNGVFVVSMYVEKQTRRIWKMLDAPYRVEDEAKVTNGAGISWVIKALRPRRNLSGGAAGG